MGKQSSEELEKCIVIILCPDVKTSVIHVSDFVAKARKKRPCI
jgi:hypothetical protein